MLMHTSNGNCSLYINKCRLQNKPEKLLAINPIHKKVPAIIYNCKYVAESMVILEYLEDVWPNQAPLMPEVKSKVRFWWNYIYKGFSTLDGAWKTAPGSPERQAAMTRFSSEGPFFTGDKFGPFDVVWPPLYSYCNTQVL